MERFAIFPNLTQEQRQARLSFARANIDRDWKRVIFSDEKIFRHQGNNPLTASVWGWISVAGPGEMCLFNGRLDRYAYMDLLKDVLLPTVKISYPDQQMIFMQVKSNETIWSLRIYY